MRYPAQSTALPPPLPPERRTVGQLIAESIKLYMERFWRAIPLGLAAIPFVLAEHSFGGGRHGVPTLAHVGLLVAIEAPVFSASYAGACLLVLGRAPWRRVALGLALGLPLFAAFRVLALLYILPGLAWLAFVGLAVPVVLTSDASPVGALRRALQLARADYAHALGGLCGITLATYVTALALTILLHTQAGNGNIGAAALADLVLFPIVFIGSALLYVDQNARLLVREAAPA
jgi:hypothetical protein